LSLLKGDDVSACATTPCDDGRMLMGRMTRANASRADQQLIITRVVVTQPLNLKPLQPTRSHRHSPLVP